MGEEQSLFSIDPAILALQMVAFGILYFVLRRYLFRPLLGLMAEREKEIGEALDAGERARAELARMDEKRESIVGKAREEGREQVRRLVLEGEEARDRILGEAREEAQEIRQRARDTVNLEREEAMMELRREVVDLALLAASRAVLGRLDTERHRRVIAEFIAGLEQEQ